MPPENVFIQNTEQILLHNFQYSGIHLQCNYINVFVGNENNIPCRIWCTVYSSTYHISINQRAVHMDRNVTNKILFLHYVIVN